MFYTSISYFNCFDDLREDYKNLPYDIEYENSMYQESKSEANAPTTPKINVKNEEGMDIKVSMKQEGIKKKKNCKC